MNIGPGSCTAAVFYQLLGRCREVAGPHGFRFKNKLLSLDATLIELLRQRLRLGAVPAHQGAVKLHLLLDHQGLLPSFAVVTEGRVHESRIARTLRFEPGAIVVFDRGYTDYAWFSALDADGVYFVTRMKDNADYGVVERRPVPERGPVQRDEIIFLYKLAREGTRSVPAPHRGLGRCPATHPGVSHQSSPLCRLHHRRHLPPALADRTLLQGAQTEPAHQDLRRHQRQRPQIQVWTALIALLLLKYLQLRARFGWSLSNLAALLRQQLFVYRDLFSWIDQPFQPPPLLAPIAEQIPLSW